jgi:hypothetical protein
MEACAPMSTHALLPCDHCARHVRRGDARCPFCGAAAPHAQAAAVTPEPAGRLSRAGVLAFVASVGAASCASPQPMPTTVQSTPAQPAETPTPPAGDAGAVEDATAATPTETPDSGATAGSPTRQPGSMMMRYGSPPRP